MGARGSRFVPNFIVLYRGKESGKNDHNSFDGTDAAGRTAGFGGPSNRLGVESQRPRRTAAPRAARVRR